MGAIPEQMARRFGSAVPWHRNSNEATPDTDFDGFVKLAGLDWEVDKLPAGFIKDGEWTVDPSKYAIVRRDTMTALGYFAPSYHPVQPHEVMDFFRNLILLDDRFELETAGTMKGGKLIWCLARYREDMTVLGEKHTAYVLFTTSFDGTLATTAQATIERVVCENTLMGSIFAPTSATVRVRHDTKWSPAVAANCVSELASVSASFPRYTELAESLANISVSRSTMEDLFSKLIDPKAYAAINAVPEDHRAAAAAAMERSTRYDNIFADMLASYDKTLDEGTQAGTAWTVLNAVTRYVDHERTARSQTGDSPAIARMNSSFFGTGAKMKGNAVKSLLALA